MKQLLILLAGLIVAIGPAAGQDASPTRKGITTIPNPASFTLLSGSTLNSQMASVDQLIYKSVTGAQSFTQLTGSIVPTVTYDGSVWVRTAGVSTTATVGYGGVFTTSTAGFYYQRTTEGKAKLSWFGATKNDATDDAAAINNTLTYAGATGATTIGESGTYVMGSGITIDISKNRLEVKGVFLNYTPTSGTAITVTGSNNAALPPYNQTANGLEGLILSGPGMSNTATVGILYSNPNDGGTSQTTVSKVKVSGFGKGVVIGDNAYIVTLNDCFLTANNIGIYNPNGINSGEKITLNGGAIYNNNKGVQHDNNVSDMFLNNLSLDYNPVQATVNGGRLYLNNIHCEGRNYTTYPFIVTGDGGLINWTHGTLLQTPSTVFAPAIFNVTTDNTAQSGLVLDKIFLHNTQTTSNYLADGSCDQIRGTNISGYANNQSVIGLCASANLLTDGGFENASIPDLVLVTGGTNTSRFATNQGNSIQTSTSQFHSGASSLQLTKSFGGGTPCGLEIHIPVSEGDPSNLYFWYNKPGSSTGQIFYNYYWNYGAYITAPGSISYTSQTSIGGSSFTLPSSAVGWTQVGLSQRMVPRGANELVLVINAVNWSGQESMFFDDAFASQLGTSPKRVGVGNTYDVATALRTPKHLTGGSSTPTISTSTGAGSSPTVTLSSGSEVSTDLSGVISLTTGTSPANGLIVRITYAGTYSRIPKVAIDGSNDPAALNRTLYRVSNRTLTGFDIVNTSTNTLPASTAFLITYIVTE